MNIILKVLTLFVDRSKIVYRFENWVSM